MDRDFMSATLKLPNLNGSRLLDLKRWGVQVTDVALSAGAGFLVAIAGAMMLMPGLPKASRALAIDVDENGEIIGMS